MPHDLTPSLLTYARAIRLARRTDPNIIEPALAPHFQTLLAATLAHELPGADLTVSPENWQPGVGRPDVALARAGQPPRAFVELKAVDKPADPTRWRGGDGRQYKRFSSLPCWATSNFVDLCRLERDEVVARATVVPAKALDPATPDAKADKLVRDHDPTAFAAIVRTLALADPPPVTDDGELAANLAHAAKLLKAIIADRLDELRQAGTTGTALQITQADFRDVLFAHPEAGGYGREHSDELFASAYAQTLAFGLLLVREATGAAVDAEAWRHMPEQHPLMRSALRLLSQEETVADAGLGFTVMLDTVNSFDLSVLAVQANGRDPILTLYEDFLATFDPRAREKYGVYYTPVEVVRYMVGALDRALIEHLGTDGLKDPAVTVLDPATGTGTFLLSVAERVRDTVGGGEGTRDLALRQLASRLYGLELLIGPYAVAHYRLHHALTPPPAEGAERRNDALPRLGVYLADTLSRPNVAEDIAVRSGFLGEPIRQERLEADRIKSRQPVLAILGNPPYRRLEEGEDESLVGRWMTDLWEDLKRPVSEAGWGGDLKTFNELSVAFWRWSMWKLFEADGAPGRGVVAFITNRKFLTGHPYAGLRLMMRERFDRIEIIDLHGDLRRGARAGVTGDQGVFNIMVGTAITLAVADGSREGELAEVRYTDSWNVGLFSKTSKLGWLLQGAESGARPGAVKVVRGTLDDFRPIPFHNGSWVSLRSCFSFAHSGVETKRDELAYGFSQQSLQDQIRRFTEADDETAAQLYSSKARTGLPLARATEFDLSSVREVAYCPLDNRFLFNERGYVDRPRPKLQKVWGEENVGFFAMAYGTGAGPAIWAHGLLPDRHAFKGSTGGYAFPLHDRRAGHGPLNLSPALVAALGEAYGAAVSADDVFDAILALLSATSYTLLFAQDLEDSVPHVPFPADPAVFARAAAIGRDIRALETFARAPAAAFDTAELGLVRGVLKAGDWREAELEDGAIVLGDDGSGRLSGIPAAVWSFAVSGYRVLPRWLAARAGLPIDLALGNQVRDLVGRLAELLDLFDRADEVLVDALAGTLTRDELGFGETTDDETEEPDDAD